MSIKKLVTLPIALAAVLMVASGVEAQKYQPFIDPLMFDPDFQFFAPAEYGEFGCGEPANTGWFASFDRMYIWVTRPRLEESYTRGDFTWGNRLDVGYMTEENSGWLFSAIHVDGPSMYDTLLIPRVNRVNEDDMPPEDDDDVDPVFPLQDRNDPETMARNIWQQQSQNVADLSGFELNKTWRLEPYHYGGVLEPFVGFRYMKFKDFTRREDYFRTDDMGVINFPVPNTTDLLEQITIDESVWQNDMVGGQVGARFFRRHSRWTLSGELRVFALQNFQNFSNVINVERILYDGVGNDSMIDTEQRLRSRFDTHDSEFVWGTDVRGEAAFALTRDISLMLGVQFLGFAQGIARGNDIRFNDEEVYMVGGTLGLSVNR